MTFIDNIKQTYTRGDMVIKLIFVNIGVFLAVSMLSIVFKLFNLTQFYYTSWFSVPSNLQSLANHFWTPITYMFYHEQFFHILFNLLVLFWFGKIFLTFYSEKQLLSLYFIGGLFGAAAYVLAYNFFPYYASIAHRSILMGASGSIIAILVASAVRVPNMEMHLLLLGRIKLKWIAVATVVISFFGITGKNGGGEIAHLGGALAGYLFVHLERKGKDMTSPLNRVIDFFVNIFKPRPKQKRRVYHSQKMSDAEFNQQKAENEKIIDQILDKIKTSGYESLTTEEKRRLFDQKK